MNRILGVRKEGDEYRLPAQGGLRLSPDGRDLVYSAIAEEGPPGPEGDVIGLYHRRLNEPTSRALPGTEYAHWPVFSPDGHWIAFYSRSDRKLKKITLSGGGAVNIADAPWYSWAPGLSWSETGHILLAEFFSPVRRIPAAGGEAEIVVPRSALRPGASPGSTRHTRPADLRPAHVSSTGSIP